MSPSTRLKYYYKAQKDFEKRTGKPAYRQVSPSTTFAEYFERQDDAFKRSWLGAKRYEAYRNGAKFGDVVKPAATYRATTDDLTPPSEKPKETAASDDKTDKTSATPPANEVLAPWEGPDELARLREKKRLDPATLPTLDGSPKQIAWVRDRIRADQVDAFNAVDFPEYLKTRIGGATDDEEEAARLALVRAEIAKRGEAAVLAELEEAAQEIAAKMFAEPSCRAWIDGRFGPGVLHRSTTEALRRVATTGSAKPPKPAFDLPPLDLPELVLTRLEGTPRQQSWAEDLRRRAVRDLTEERANETARDALRRYRDKESAFAEEFRSDLEAAIKAVGGDEAAELIFGREIFLDARGHVENFDRARDWIGLHVADKKTLLEAAEFHVAGNPQNVAEILRRYAADAKAQAPQDLSLFGRKKDDGKPKPLRRWTKEDKERQQKAAAFAKEKYKIDADYSNIPPDVAEAMNEELGRVKELTKTFGLVEKLGRLDDSAAVARYVPDEHAVLFRPDMDCDSLTTNAQTLYDKGKYSTPNPRHSFWHEIAHAIMQEFRQDSFWAKDVQETVDAAWVRVVKNPALLSEYARKNSDEMIGEAFAYVVAHKIDGFRAPSDEKRRFAIDLIKTLWRAYNGNGRSS